MLLVLQKVDKIQMRKYRIYKILPWVNYAIKNNITQDVTNIRLDSMPRGYKTAQSAAEQVILARVETGEITPEAGADEYFKKLRSLVKKDVMQVLILHRLKSCTMN